MTVFKQMDNYYKRLCACSSSSGRKYNGLAMLELIKENPELLDYWQVDTSYYHWENRFKKIKDYDADEHYHNNVSNEFTLSNRGSIDYLTNKKHFVNTMIQNLNQVYNKNIFCDGINFSMPEASGLYLVGECTFNPYTDEKYYGIKIGLGKNLKNRIATYKTCGLTPFVCDYLQVPESELQYAESVFHTILHSLCVATNSHNEEWFYVNKATYLAICEEGFNYFIK